MITGPWDAHTHCSDDAKPELETETHWQNLFALGLNGVVFGGIDPEDWERQAKLKEKLGDAVRISYGMHPWFVQNKDGETVDKAWEKLREEVEQADAVGECGLDYFVAKSEEDRQKQLSWCERQLNLAQESSKPLILHVVKAHEPMLQMLSAKEHWRGLVHAFTGDLKTAEQYVALGFKLSLDKRISPENLGSLLRGLPPDAWVIESDAHGSEALDLIAARCSAIVGNAPQEIMEAQGQKLGQIFTGA